MNKTLKIFTSVLVIAIVIGGIAFFSLRGNGSTDDKQISEDVAKLESDDLSPDDLDKKMKDLGYEVYENSTDSDKYAYHKLDGEDTEFIFIKDYNKQDAQALFIMNKTIDGSKFIFSTTKIEGEKSSLLIEKEVVTDCSKDKCVTSGEKEINVQQYTYNYETGKFKAVAEYENAIKLSDIQTDFDIFNKELNKIYK